MAMARADLDRVAKEYGVTRASRYINALELAAAENVAAAPATDAAGHATIEKERLVATIKAEMSHAEIKDIGFGDVHERVPPILAMKLARAVTGNAWVETALPVASGTAST